MGSANIGQPVDDFVKKGKQEHQTRLFNETIEQLNFGMKHIHENYGGKISLSVDESKDYPQLVASVEFPNG